MKPKPEPKFCLDCAHCLPASKFAPNRCTAVPMRTDLCTGLTEYTDCVTARALTRLCGRAGKLFQPHRLK